MSIPPKCNHCSEKPLLFLQCHAALSDLRAKTINALHSSMVRFHLSVIGPAVQKGVIYFPRRPLETFIINFDESKIFLCSYACAR